MKKSLLIIAVSGLVLSACNKDGAGTTGEFKNDQDKLGYSIGVDIGRNIEKAQIDSLEIESMLSAIRDVLNKKDLKITDEEAKKFLMEYFEKKQRSEFTEKIAQNDKFFADNAKKAGVTALPSGLQYEVIKSGTGAKPGINDEVTVHYHGTLLDGRVFDSSIDRNEPATFQVGGVITGWTEALQLMPVGSKWKLYVPASLGYGERGAGGIIGPNETLVFEVELISINKK